MFLAASIALSHVQRALPPTKMAISLRNECIFLSPRPRPRLGAILASSPVQPAGVPQLASIIASPEAVSDRTSNFDNLIFSAFAFTSGWANVVCFVLYKSFASMMTGNTMSIMFAIARRRWVDSAFFLAMVFNYVAGVMFFRLFDVGPDPHSQISGAAAVIFSIFLVHDVLACVVPGSRWIALLVAFGFGFVNAATSETLGVVTCMVTGHWQKLANALSDLLTTGLSHPQRAAAFSSLFILLGFCAGVASGSVVMASPFSVRPVLSTVGAAFAFLFLQFNRRRRMQVQTT